MSSLSSSEKDPVYPSIIGYCAIPTEQYRGEALWVAMDDYRSRSHTSVGTEIEWYSRKHTDVPDVRSHSGHSYPRDTQVKKAKNPGGSSSSKVWGFSDPEFQRKKRVASYKMYSYEGKVKGSLRKSFRWLKDKYVRAVYGWW